MDHIDVIKKLLEQAEVPYKETKEGLSHVRFEQNGRVIYCHFLKGSMHGMEIINTDDE